MHCVVCCFFSSSNCDEELDFQKHLLYILCLKREATTDRGWGSLKDSSSGSAGAQKSMKGDPSGTGSGYF